MPSVAILSEIKPESEDPDEDLDARVNGNGGKRARPEGAGEDDSYDVSDDRCSDDSKPETVTEPEVKRRKSNQPHKLKPTSQIATCHNSNAAQHKGTSSVSHPSPMSDKPPHNNWKQRDDVGSGNGSSNGASAAVKIQGFNHEFELEMNLGEPLRNLIRLIQPTLNFDLSQADIYLCGVQKLSSGTCLKDCVRDGSQGIVKVKIVTTVVPEQLPRINIVDVLQAADIPPRASHKASRRPPLAPATPETVPYQGNAKPKKRRNRPTKSKRASAVDKSEWLPSESFEHIRDSLSLAENPLDWTISDVSHWLSWATKTFDLPDLNVRLFSELDGATLCSLSRDMFTQLVGKDENDFFWTHVEMLRSTHKAVVPFKNSESPAALSPKMTSHPKSRAGTLKSSNHQLFAKESSGTIQLWQFLLELLAAGDHRDSLEWVGDSAEFKLNNPERVAELWGFRKNKANMNYEKMSRALRYYYDGEILAKVPGKHFTYKFICDLKKVVGFSLAEINAMSGMAPRSSLSPDLDYATPSPSIATSSIQGSCATSDAGIDVEEPAQPIPRRGKTRAANHSMAAALDLRRLHGHGSSQLAA